MLLRLVMSLTLAAPTAGEHTEAASAAFEKRDYEAAAEALRRAHALDPAPRYIYGQAQAARAGGDCARAEELYERFIALNEAPKAREDARAWAGECRVMLQAIGAAHADVKAGDYDDARRRLMELGATPASPELLLARASVEIADEDCDSAAALIDAFALQAPFSPRLESARRELESCGAPPPPVVPPPTAAVMVPPAPTVVTEPQSPRRIDPLSAGLGGAGLGVALAGGGVLLASRLRFRNAANDDEARFSDDIELARRLDIAGIATLCVGGALVVAGIVHYVARGRRER
ncbi:MAG: tetratricopeptide repeat protein [Nannocystales bacterium]